MTYANARAEQNKQLMTMAIVMFVTIVAAVTFSAVLVSTLVKGEVAKALSNNTPVTTAQSINAPVSPVAAGASCAAPAVSEAGEGAHVSAASAGGHKVAKALPWTGYASISGSFNNSQTSTTNTSTNNTVNRNRYTVINDSFKVATDNTVVVGNNVASNNNANSNNTSNTTTNNTTTTTTTNTTTNTDSNNTNSNNTTTNTDNSVNVEDNQVALAVGLVAAAVNVD